MDAQKVRDEAEAALNAVGFSVRENDDQGPHNDPAPGGVCLFIQDGQVRLYLLQRPQWAAADVAARALASRELRVVPVGADPAESEIRSAYVLLGGTGELAEGRDPMRGPLGEGWRNQYQRMLRSHQRLAEAAGPSSVGSDEARDRLFHFFQDAYHLKDWLKNDDDPLLPSKKDVEALFTDPQQRIPDFQLTADLCNGVKHRTLWSGSSKTGDDLTNIIRQDAHVMLGGPATATAYVGGASPRVVNGPPPSPTLGEHRWFVASNGQQREVMNLADEIVETWNAWLASKGLLPWG